MLKAIAQVIYFCYKLYRIIKRSMSGYWNAKVKVLVGSKEEIEVKFTRKNGNFFNYQNQPEVWILEILGNLMKLCCQNKWHLVHDIDSLFYWVFKAKYFPNCSTEATIDAIINSHWVVEFLCYRLMFQSPWCSTNKVHSSMYNSITRYFDLAEGK